MSTLDQLNAAIEASSIAEAGRLDAEEKLALARASLQQIMALPSTMLGAPVNYDAAEKIAFGCLVAIADWKITQPDPGE